eukprot:TRINITY_DN2968_c0_g2_i2.p1 TRINITY_DN2968_c0_g2~~TRINITY_DN2968_c0_g2_i2.p1  ORF type:complete len:139 (-),score=38.78 TRINITY_DN2968_c0_g2_i2:88-504(-)
MNLSPIRNTTGDFLVPFDSASTISLNFCGPLLYPKNFCPPGVTDAIACLSGTTSISLGSASQVTYAQTAGTSVRAQFAGGTGGASTYITLGCVSSLPEGIRYTGNRGNIYFFSWGTKLLCGNNTIAVDNRQPNKISIN